MLFNIEHLPVIEPENKRKRLDGAIWTKRKALLIQVYLQYFTYITKRGTYIDAFAGPQDETLESKTWAAKRVWENNPGAKRRRIDRFEFFELNKTSFGYLKEMVSGIPRDGRKVRLTRGNCNLHLPRILGANPIKGPSFCLLDQRTDECDWSTVLTVANHKADPTKIEIFYFVMGSWFARYKAALAKGNKDKRMAQWMGEDFAPRLDVATPQRAAEILARRFKEELGYAFADPYPIFDNLTPSAKGQAKFYMIHASDHAEAPILMRRSYQKLASGWDPDAKQEGMCFLDDDLGAVLSNLPSWDGRISDEEKAKRSRRGKKP